MCFDCKMIIGCFKKNLNGSQKRINKKPKGSFVDSFFETQKEILKSLQKKNKKIINVLCIWDGVL